MHSHREGTIPSGGDATRTKDETLRTHWNTYKKREISVKEMFDRIVSDLKLPSQDRSQDDLDYDRFIADE